MPVWLVTALPWLLKIGPWLLIGVVWFAQGWRIDMANDRTEKAKAVTEQCMAGRAIDRGLYAAAQIEAAERVRAELRRASDERDAQERQRADAQARLADAANRQAAVARQSLAALRAEFDARPDDCAVPAGIAGLLDDAAGAGADRDGDTRLPQTPAHRPATGDTDAGSR